jgi:hypothetical protein
MKKLLGLLFGLTSLTFAQSTLATFELKELVGVFHTNQMCEVPYTGAKLTLSTTALLAPNGVDQEPFQLLRNGYIAFPCHLPASTVYTTYQAAGTPITPSSTSIQWPGYEYSFPVNQLVRLSVPSSSAPCGLTDTDDYFVKNYTLVPSGGSPYLSLSFSATPGGSALTTTNCAVSLPSLTYTGFQVASNVFTAPTVATYLANRDPIQFEGTIPSQLTADTNYYVTNLNVGAGTFQISATVGGSAITGLDNINNALNKVIFDWTHTLQSLTTPTATFTNPIVCTTSASYITCDNGLVAIRVAQQTNPTKTFNASNGNPSCVISGSAPTQTIVCTVAGHGLSGGNTISISGCATSYANSNFGPCGVFTLASVTTNTFTVTGQSGLSNDTYNTTNNPNLTIINADLSVDAFQGFRLTNGNWVATGGRLWQGETSGSTSGSALDNMNGSNSLPVKLMMATNYQLFYIDFGPGKTTIQTTYTLNRPVYTKSGISNLAGSVATTSAKYTMTFTMYANQSSFLVDIDDGGMNIGHMWDVYGTWGASPPDTIQRRTDGLPNNGCGVWGPQTITAVTVGNPTLVTAPNHSLNGVGGALTVSGATGTGAITALNASGLSYTVVDSNTLSVNANTTGGTYNANSASYIIPNTSNNQSRLTTYTETISYTGTIVTAGCGGGSRDPLSVWNSSNTGGNWQQLFNASASSGAPAVAMYTGKAGVQLNAVADVMGWQTSNNLFSTSAQGAAIYFVSMPCYQQTNTAPVIANCAANIPTFAPNNHRQFGIWSGTKAGITVANPQTANAVSLEQNHTAGISLTEQYSWNLLNFPDPAGGFQSPYIPTAHLATIANNYKNNVAGFKTIVDSTVSLTGDSYSANILTCFVSQASGCLDAILSSLIPKVQDCGVGIAEYDGIYDGNCFGSELLNFAGQHIANAAYALQTSFISGTQKTSFKNYAGWIGSLIVDPNFTPLFPNGVCVCGDQGGTFNQTNGYNSLVSKAATFFPSHPYIGKYTANALTTNQQVVQATINGSGTGASSASYLGTNDQTFLNLLALNQNLAGFNSSSYPTLPLYYNFLSNYIAPPDPRWGNVRKLPAIGEATYTAVQQPGFLASLYGTNTDMGSWYNQNTPTLLNFNSFFGPPIISIDTTLTNPGMPTLSTYNAPGYYTAGRFNQNSTHENWYMVLNGEFYSDHAQADRGSFVSYFHNVPLVVDLSSNIYQPDCPGRICHSALIYSSEFTSNTQNASYPWYGAPTSMYDPVQTAGGSSSTNFAAVGATAQTEVLNFTYSSYSCQTYTNSDTTVWKRCVVLTNGNPAFPLFGVYDTFPSGTNAGASKTIQFNLLYDSTSVTTPSGNVTPVTDATHTTQCVSEGPAAPPSVFPSAGTATGLGSGIQAFNVKGQNMPNLAGNGINSDIWIVRGTSGAQYAVAGWGHMCEDSITDSQYKAAQTLTQSGGGITNAVAADATHLQITFAANSHNYVVGDQASTSGFVGSGNVNSNASCNGVGNVGPSVSAVSGNVVTFKTNNGDFSGLSGSYTSGSVIPCFRERVAILKVNDSGSFTTVFGPYLKSSVPSRTITNPACGVQVVTTSPVSSTECVPAAGGSFYTYTTSGGLVVLDVFDSSTQTFNGLKLSGGPGELAQVSSSTIVATISGMTPSTRTIDLSGLIGTWCPDQPIIKTSANVYTVYHEGGLQPNPHVITFTNSCGTFKTRTISGWNGANTPPSAATLELRYGSATNFMASSACSPACAPITVYTPTGTTPWSYRIKDSSGNVLANSVAESDTN